MLVAGALASLSAAADGGPPEGSPAWSRAQRLLARPAPALASAYDAWQRGDRLRAAWLLAEVMERHAIIGDYAALMRAKIALEQEDPEATIELAANALERFPESPLRAELAALLGEAKAAVHDEKGARAAYRLGLDSTRRESLRAALLLATATSEERSGLGAEAATTYRVLWYLYPTTEEAAVAGRWLDARSATQGGGPRSADDWRRRGDALFRKRRNSEALAAYDQALEAGLSDSHAARVRRQRAQTLFRMRQYPRAVEAFAALPQVEDVPIWYARSLARAGRVPESIARFEDLSQRRHGVRSLRARFLAASLLEGRGFHERARAHLETLTHDRSSSALKQASLWRLGWAAYSDGRYADAISLLDQLEVEEKDPIGRLRTRYWRARALERLGDGEGQPQALASARDAFEEIARAWSLSYYGWRSRERLSRLPPGRSAVAAVSAGAPGSRPVPPPGARKLPPIPLARARILLEAGLTERALAELEAASRRTGGLADRLELAGLFYEAGNYREAQRLVVDPYTELLATGPIPTLEELWWHAWPAAFSDLVERATSAPGSVDPALVFSIMREESGFRPEVVSPVGARGLLQIMESTGERLARAVGQEGFTADDLFDPETNIRLGAHYLAELSDHFSGRLSAAIASYNAGPEAVAGWLEARPDVDDDEWVETIPYDQTRSYVKRVLRSLQAYRLLY